MSVPGAAPVAHAYPACADDLLVLPRPSRAELLGHGEAPDRAWVHLPARFAIEGVRPELAQATLGPGACVQIAHQHEQAPVCVRCTVQSGADGPGVPIDGQRYALHVQAPVDGVGPPVRIAAPTMAGARLALATLAQLLRRYGRRLPAVHIEDRPAFAVRAVMLDVSRCRVPTMQHLLDVIDTLAGLKCNHLQLYTEHTFAYAGHESAWSGCAPITPEQARRLDDHCAQRGIELAPNQNCFGHMHRWLRHPAYAHLAETHGDWMFDVWPRSGPFSLCPTDPRSIELVKDLLGQLLPCFRSGMVNIGCDETYDVGHGRSREAVDARGGLAGGGREAVYLDFVRSVAQVCRLRDKRAMFWADVLLHRPQSLASMPADMVALCWGYEPDSPFADWLRATGAGAEREAWVCPGTSSWRTFAGRPTERRANIACAVRDGLAGGARAVMTCDWGDVGHRQQWCVSLVGLADGLASAWHGGHADAPDARAVSLHALGDDTLQASAWLDHVGDIDLPIREVGLGYSQPDKTGRLRNASATFCDLACADDVNAQVGGLELWRACAERLAALRLPAGVRGRLGDELAHLLDVSRLAAARAVARRYKGGLSSQARALLHEQLRHVVLEHTRLWLMTSRPGGLAESCENYLKPWGALGPHAEWA